jgi:hypothetical protein
MQSRQRIWVTFSRERSPVAEITLRYVTGLSEKTEKAAVTDPLVALECGRK